jgi:hypothetical protein
MNIPQQVCYALPYVQDTYEYPFLGMKLGISKPFGYRFTVRMLDWCKLPPDGT